MASRPIRRKRFALLDKLGVEKIADLYIDKYKSVRELCSDLFEPAKEGQKPGSQDLYSWIKARGHREYWDQTVWIKKEVEKERAFESVLRIMDKVDSGQATKADVEIQKQEFNKVLFEVGRRGGL